MSLRKPEPLEVLTAAVGTTFGVSVLFNGYYDLTTWGPVAIALLALLAGVAIARPAVPRGPALLGAGTLVGLWAWSLLSTAWAASPGAALEGSSRWLMYASMLALLLLLLRDEGLRKILLGALGGSVLLVAVYLTARMAVGEGQSLFEEGRLIEPLGYVNGQAGYLLMGFWPLVAVAERGRPVVAGIALGAAILVTSLAVLSETRAILPAFALSVVVLLVLVPNRVRRGLVLVTVTGGVAVISRVLLHVYNAPAADFATSVREAGVTALLSAAVFGAGWAIVGSQLDFVTRWSADTRRSLKRRGIPLGIVAVVAGLALVGSLADPVDRARQEWATFKDLGNTAGSSPFLSGGGGRYDYWRVSIDELADNPTVGVGQGSWDTGYYRHRRTAATVRQPHSIIFQTLAELGAVGGLLLLGFVAALVWAFWRLARAADAVEHGGVTVAAGGIVLMWFAHTSVDWLHVLPGVTGMAMCGAAVLLAPWMKSVAAPARRSLAAGAVVAVAAVAGAVLIGRLALSERALGAGQRELDGDPPAALRQASDALALNDDSLDALVLRAAAYARLDDYARSRAALLEAARLEPESFVPYELLGDIAVRKGDLPVARAAYLRAQELNPRDAAIAQALAAAQ